MEGFSFDLKIWINDYLETLEQEEDQAQMEKVCRKLLDLFAWKEEAPADLRFRLASSMLSLDKKKRPVISARDGTCRMKMILQLQRR